jgi:hypothetical protein
MSADWSPTMNLRFCRSQCGVYTFLQQQFTREGCCTESSASLSILQIQNSEGVPPAT